MSLIKNWLLVPKVLYFVVNLQYYTLHQFRAAFAREKFEVENSQYGKLTGLIMFTTFFTNIAIGNFSDKKRNHRSVLLFLAIITPIIFSLFFLDVLMAPSVYCFWFVLFLYLVFNNPKQPLLDKIVIDYLSNISDVGPTVYGKQRLWGTLSYGVATCLTEWCLSKKGTDEYEFSNMLYYSFATTMLAVPSIVLLIGRRSEREEDVKEVAAARAEEQQDTKGGDRPINRSSSYMQLLSNWEFLFFIFIMFSNAVTRSAMTFYLNIFHREVLQLKPYELSSQWPRPLRSVFNLVLGKPITMLTVSGISCEVLVMFVSDKLISRWGLFFLLFTAQVFALVRFMAYYTMSQSSPHAFLLSCFFELIKGIYFGLAHISGVHIATRLAPIHLRATSQMIYQGTFNALGSLVSGIFFGFMFESMFKKGSSREKKGEGFLVFFIMNAAICFATIMVYLYKYGVKDRVLFNRRAEEEKLDAASNQVHA